MRLLIFALFASLLPAQTPLQLSLKKAIEIATAPDGNARIELAREAIAQAEIRRQTARAAFLPNIDGAVSYQDTTRNLQAFGINFPTIPGFRFSSFVGPFGIFDARANASLSVLDFSNIRRYQAARSATDAARKEQSAVRNTVTDQVARAYLIALRAGAHVDTAKANLALAEALIKLADSQKRAGTGTGIELTRAEVQRANERQRLQVAENERTKAHLQLLRAMDLKLETDLVLTDALVYAAPEALSFDQALQSAVAQRPDYLAQQQREATARLSYQAAGFERLPSVVAFGDYGAIGTSIDVSRATRTVGLSLRVPIFDGGRRNARRAEAASQMRSEGIRARDLRQQLELELRLAFDSLRSAELQVKTAAEGLALAEKELAQAQRRYEAGVANGLEVTDAQTRLMRARDNRIAALFQHNLAKLDLGYATGAVERYLP